MVSYVLVQHQESARAKQQATEGAQSTSSKTSLMTMVALKQRAERIRSLESEVAEKEAIISELREQIMSSKTDFRQHVSSSVQVTTDRLIVQFVI